MTPPILRQGCDSYSICSSQSAKASASMLPCLFFPVRCRVRCRAAAASTSAPELPVCCVLRLCRCIFLQGLKSSAHPLKILAYQQREALEAGAEVLQPASGARTRPAKHWLVIAPARRNIVQARAAARQHFFLTTSPPTRRPHTQYSSLPSTGGEPHTVHGPADDRRSLMKRHST